MTLVLLVLLALAFDFLNGFHDAANSIATVVSTGVLTPWQAVLWAVTVPAAPKSPHGRPVTASMAMSRASRVPRKTRRAQAP